MSTRDPQSIRDAAVALLARRDFLTAQLRAALESRGCDPAATAVVIAELIEERLLDDTRFVERYVAARTERGQGPVRIAADLASLGAPEALIEAALAAEGSWSDLAEAVRRRKFGSARPRSAVDQARQARFLQYRGFSSDDIRSATGADIEPD